MLLNLIGHGRLGCGPDGNGKTPRTLQSAPPVGVAGERPDLVVLDFIMSGLSGADVATRIRAEAPEQPILFVSGYSETDAVRVAPNAPC